MGTRTLILTLALAVILSSAGRAEEAIAEGRITSVGLFKNGLAVVEREVVAPGPGKYRLDDLPVPVHGTFWIGSEVPVRARTTTREVERSLEAPGRSDYHASLVGQDVIIHFVGGAPAPATGRVTAVLPTPRERVFSREYRETHPYWYDHRGSWSRSAPHANPATVLVLDTGRGRSFVNVAQIAQIHASGKPKRLTDTVPSLVLEVAAGKTFPQTIRVAYLTKGLCWAPSYHVDLSDPTKLTVAQKAVVRNELMALNDVEVKLISGFPNIPFSHVTSPAAPSATLASFFDALSTRRTDARRGVRYQVMSQMANNVVSNFASGDRRWSPGAESLGAETDIHYQSIGKTSLLAGDSLTLGVAEASATYERIVEWVLPDMRDERGHYIRDHRRRENPEKYEEATWDAVRFTNPLPFPMTTAPAAFTLPGGRFGGQTLSRWVGRGEETILHITKALSVHTRCAELEEETSDERVYVYGNDYRRSVVKGTLLIENHRKKAVKMIVRRHISGNALTVDGEPEQRLLGGGVMHVNARRELRWDVTLEPGEKKELGYRYEVLVDC